MKTADTSPRVRRRSLGALVRLFGTPFADFVEWLTPVTLRRARCRGDREGQQAIPQSKLPEAPMLPSTVDRVSAHTADEINLRIRRQTEANIANYARAGGVAIGRRLKELDEEWDIERTLEANAATASLIGLTLGATVDRRWFLFPAVVAGFLLQHALQGWCPPLVIFRQLGVRTASEIDYERYALKALRGDFKRVNDELTEGTHFARHAFEAAARG
jgi:hypothetical protein